MSKTYPDLVERYERDTKRMMTITLVILGLLVASNIGLGLTILDVVDENKKLSEQIVGQSKHLTQTQHSAKTAAEAAVALAHEEVAAQERARINADLQVQAIKDAIRCLRSTRTLRGYDRCIANLPPLQLRSRNNSSSSPPRPSPSPQPQPSPSSTQPSPTPCSTLPVTGMCRPGV